MVKTRYALIGTILAFTTLLTAIPMAAAYEYSPILVIKSDGQIWEFSTLNMDGTEMFSSKDVVVSSIKAYYWVGADTFQINIKDVHLAGNKVSITFNKDFLPPEADGTRVVGELYNGDTFIATGPGFVWRKWG